MHRAWHKDCRAALTPHWPTGPPLIVTSRHWGRKKSALHACIRTTTFKTDVVREMPQEIQPHDELQRKDPCEDMLQNLAETRRTRETSRHSEIVGAAGCSQITSENCTVCRPRCYKHDLLGAFCAIPGRCQPNKRCVSLPVALEF